MANKCKKLTCACSISNVELAGFRKVRSEGFRWKFFTWSLLATSMCVSLLPLFVTQTWSFGAAEEQCEEWAVELYEIYANTTDFGYGDIDDNADRQLFPVHTNNVASLWVSVACLLGWYFISPHNSAMAEGLDYPCETIMLSVIIHVFDFAPSS